MTALEKKDTIKFKGTVFLGLRAFVYDQLNPNYWEELVIKTRFPTPNPLAASWFDGELYPRMLNQVSMDINQSIKHTVIKVAKYSVEYDLNGIYRFLMKVSGLLAVLAKIPRLSNSYSTSSPMSVVLNEEGRYQIRIEASEIYFEFISWCAEGATHAILNQFKIELQEFKMLESDAEMIDVLLNRKGIFEATY